MKTALWPLIYPLLVLSLLSYDRLSRKPLLFKSFTGLTVQEFDNIYSKKIAKKYDKYELQRLSSKRKDVRERKAGAVGRPFKLHIKDRFLMLLVYYHRLYITYTLAGFLFGLDQSNICRDIQKIEPLIRNCLPIPKKDIQHYQKAPNPWRDWKVFSRLFVFHRFHRTTDTKAYR